MSYIVCTYYTPDYEDDFKRLKASLDKYGIDCWAKPVESLGTWEANVIRKPEIIFECMQANLDKDVLYTDADSEIVGDLSFLDDIETDLAIHTREVKRRSKYRHGAVHFLGGTIYFKNNLEALGLLQSWIDFGKIADKYSVGQDTLIDAITNSPGLTMTQLPAEYLSIQKRDGTFSDEMPIVKHYQASRRQKSNKARVKAKRMRNRIIGVTVVVAVIIISFLAMSSFATSW